MVAFRTILSSLLLPIFLAQSVYGAGLLERDVMSSTLQDRAIVNGNICAQLNLSLLGVDIASGVCICAKGGALTPASIATLNTQVTANRGLLSGVITLLGGVANVQTRLIADTLPLLLSQDTQCVYPANSTPNTCGSCGYACDTGFTASRGLCCGPNTAESNGVCCSSTQVGCNGQCVAPGTLCCAPGTTASNGVCCPSTQFGCNGQCVATGTLCCGTTQKNCNGQCVPSAQLCCGAGTFDCNGQCVTTGTLCCGTGQKNCNGQCVPTANLCCGTGTFNCNGQCVTTGTLCCGSTQKECNGQCIPTANLCCGINQQACNGQCIASSIVCCATGFFACGTQCVATGVVCQSGRVVGKRDFRNINTASCPVGFEACRIPSASGAKNAIGTNFECINTANDLESCGGCVLPLPGRPHGQDCSSIPDVDSAICQAGRCVIESCSRGFTNNGTACINTGSSGRKLSGYWAALHEATHILVQN